MASTRSPPDISARRLLCHACQSRATGSLETWMSTDFKNKLSAGFSRVCLMTRMMSSGSSRQSFEWIARARMPNSWSQERSGGGGVVPLA